MNFNDWCNGRLVFPSPQKWLIVLFLFIFSLGLRTTLLNPGFFHHDALLLVDAVENSVRSGTLQPKLDGRYAYVLLNVPLYLLARTCDLPLDVVLNFSTAVLAAIAVVLLYLLASELVGGGLWAFAAAMLFSVFPIFLSISTHTKSHAFSTLLVTGAFFTLVRGIKTDHAGWFAGSILFFTAAVSTRIPNILFLLPMILLFIGFCTKNPATGLKEMFRPERLFYPILLAGFPALLILLQWPAIAAKAKYDVFLGMFASTQRVTLGDLYHCLGPAGTAILLLGLAASFFTGDRWVIGSFLLAAVLLFEFYSNIVNYTARYLTDIVPFLAFFLAAGLHWIDRKSRLLALGLFLYLLATMLATIVPILWYRHNVSGEKAFSQWVGSVTEPESLIISMDDGVFIRYYAKRQTLPHPQSGSPREIRAWVEEVGAAIRRGQPVYLMESGLTYDPGRRVAQAITANFAVEDAGRHACEDYHHSDIYLNVYTQRLFRLNGRALPAGP